MVFNPDAGVHFGFQTRLALQVDDFQTQGLHLELWSDELGFDRMLGEGALPFSFPSLIEDGLEFPNLLADFIQVWGPMLPVDVCVRPEAACQTVPNLCVGMMLAS